MDAPLRIVPASNPKTASVQDTANSLGLHDTLQYGPRSIAAEVRTANPIKDRLDQVGEQAIVEATQDNLKLTLRRAIYEIHAPLRALMERKMVAYNPHPPAMRVPNIHLHILMGRDENVEPADFMMQSSDMMPPQSIHAEMVKKLRM